MNIEIKITADSVEEARAAFAKLASERPATHITVIPSDPRVEGGELTILAGTDLTIASASRNSVVLTSDPTQEPMKAPEKPKRIRKPAVKAPESPQKPTGEPEAQRAAETPTAPETPTDAPQSAPELGGAQYGEPTPTIDQIAAAGARLLDDDANKMTALLDLLGKYGVQAITQLKPEQLAGFAADLRALGAEV